MSRLHRIALTLIRQARATGARPDLRADGPRLWVGCLCVGVWRWELVAAGAVLDGGEADTWDEAMAVGLAALEVACLAPTTSAG